MWQKEQVIAEFQKRGMRITRQRKGLLDVILNDFKGRLEQLQGNLLRS